MSLVVWFLLTVSFFLTFVLCLIHIRKKYSFWMELGVLYIPARFPLGNIQHTSHLMLELYRELKGKNPFGGLFQFTEPVALITDPEMVKNVLVRDFRHFYGRGGYSDGKHDPLSGHMLNSEGERWYALRRAASPIFTIGRLKSFFPVMLQMTDHFREYLNAKLDTEGAIVEMKSLLGQLNTDIAMRFVLGIEGNNLTSPEGGLHEGLMREMFLLPNVWKLFLMTCCRSIARKIRLKMFSRDVTELFQIVVQETMDHRKESCVSSRNDLIDQVLEMPGFDGKITLTLSEMTAQVFLFLGAYEATGITLFYCLYELAQSPDVQERARVCVLETLEKHGGITYDALADMEYIDQCLNETLRKYPPAINLIRVVTKDYPIPDSSGIMLPKGLNIIVPVYAIHYDSEYYPEPERFDPDRFSPVACKQHTPYTFLPFGMGPKNCVGYRQGVLQLRLMLAVLLSSYEFTKCPEITQGSLSEAHTVIKLNGDLWLNVKRIHSTDGS